MKRIFILLTLICCFSLYAVKLSLTYNAYPRDARARAYANVKNQAFIYDAMQKELGDSIFFNFLYETNVLKPNPIFFNCMINGRTPADMKPYIHIISPPNFPDNNAIDSFIQHFNSNYSQMLDSLVIKVWPYIAPERHQESQISIPEGIYAEEQVHPLRMDKFAVYNLTDTLNITPSAIGVETYYTYRINLGNCNNIDDVKARYQQWRENIRNLYMESFEERTERLTKICPPDSLGVFHRENYTDQQWKGLMNFSKSDLDSLFSNFNQDF